VSLPEPPLGESTPAPCRRDYLASALAELPEPIHTVDLAALSAAAGWSGNRNTARKDARALVARGLLAPLPATGNTAYTRTSKDTSCASISAAAA
jgi:hypothetical protein